MKVVPGLEMARKVPKIVFEIWGNFRFSLIPLYILTYLTFFSDIIDLYKQVEIMRGMRGKLHSQPGSKYPPMFFNTNFFDFFDSFEFESLDISGNGLKWFILW